MRWSAKAGVILNADFVLLGFIRGEEAVASRNFFQNLID